ncbi:hypothetical protein AB4K20DRAFT_1956581 [Rhizopus microsporus]|uniref:Uncharacterized protein n=1 Tax=Rhizopus microsporus TaxID=58291 RepID=A0A1X0SE13_RHIZD|nr:hypothetical protein BCV71DRAFT_260076 [Rhizopus microsporus]
METTFGSDEFLKQGWANGTLLPTIKRKRNDDDDNGTMDDGDDNNTDVDVDNNKDLAETVYKPDWAVFANGNPMITVIGTLELKISYKQNPGCVVRLCEAGKRNEVGGISIDTSWCDSTYCLWGFDTRIKMRNIYNGFFLQWRLSLH